MLKVQKSTVGHAGSGVRHVLRLYRLRFSKHIYLRFTNITIDINPSYV